MSDPHDIKDYTSGSDYDAADDLSLISGLKTSYAPSHEASLAESSVLMEEHLADTFPDAELSDDEKLKLAEANAAALFAKMQELIAAGDLEGLRALSAQSAPQAKKHTATQQRVSPPQTSAPPTDSAVKTQAVADKTKQSPSREQPTDGFAELSRGVVDLAGASAGLVGAGLSGLGKLAKQGIAVLPRLSDYRVGQIEKSYNAYVENMEDMWRNKKMKAVREAIRETAKAHEVPEAEVIAGMRPGGNYESLSRDFNSALDAEPEAKMARTLADKSLNTWGRNRNKAEESMVSLDESDPKAVGMRNSILELDAKLEASAALSPLADGEKESHLERMQSMIAAMIESIRGFINRLRGKSENSNESNHALTP